MLQSGAAQLSDSLSRESETSDRLRRERDALLKACKETIETLRADPSLECRRRVIDNILRPVIAKVESGIAAKQ